ncbi:protein FAM76B [Scaptodrosophila lebanonensis]|uniref:Protein FAM76B n=1 Tax=Drosophila lebanonensis TaxID=7225 RepID=A0A6J2TKY1_DROLE|nr:protein FAM76B [Scaptodrosophila lebanonensis]
MDNKLYCCTNCYRRCGWDDLSAQEHRCLKCRLPAKSCAICDKRFEPRSEQAVYCKRCDFNLLRHAPVLPPDMTGQCNSHKYRE